jgi:hypothetical protein
MNITLDFDDLELSKPGLDYFLKLKDHYPNLKVTFFMVPIPKDLIEKKVSLTKYREWAAFLKENGDWIELCPHGVMHDGFEMKYQPGTEKLLTKKDAQLYIEAAEHTFKQLDLPFQKIWKSPHWETAPAVYEVLKEKGYAVALDPNQPVPKEAAGMVQYFYDWSVEQPIPKKEIVKGHGHMYPPSANAVNLAFQNLLRMPTDATFYFVSESL